MYNEWGKIDYDTKERYIERAKYLVDRSYVDEEDYEIVAKIIYESEKGLDKSDL